MKLKFDRDDCDLSKMRGAELMGKSRLSEEDIKLRYITPAIQNAGWSNRQIRMEYAFTAGRIIVRGNITARGRKKSVDYLLSYKNNLPLAIVEAKSNNHPVGAIVYHGYIHTQLKTQNPLGMCPMSREHSLGTIR
jgi:type I site-specific restriction endonuclease